MILAKFRFHRFSMILLAVILMIILDAAFGKRGHRKRIIGGHPVPPGKLPFIVSHSVFIHVQHQTSKSVSKGSLQVVL